MSTPVNAATPTGRGRGFGVTVAAGLGSAALAVVAATSPWAEATTREPALRTVSVDGSEVAPLVLPLALVTLAAWGTVLVLRRRGRRVVAALAVAAGAAGAAAALLRAHTAPDAAMRALGDVDAAAAETAWPWVAAAGCAVTAVAAAVAWRLAPRWPEMSSRYDAPGASRTAPADLWKALDEGHDPTA